MKTGGKEKFFFPSPHLCPRTSADEGGQCGKVTIQKVTILICRSSELVLEMLLNMRGEGTELSRRFTNHDSDTSKNHLMVVMKEVAPEWKFVGTFKGKFVRKLEKG